jgi:hypothetical protein
MSEFHSTPPQPARHTNCPACFGTNLKRQTSVRTVEVLGSTEELKTCMQVCCLRLFVRSHAVRDHPR